MSFNDECDLVDDDRYDLFTLTIQIERLRCSRGARKQQPASAGQAFQTAPRYAVCALRRDGRLSRAGSE